MAVKNYFRRLAPTMKRSMCTPGFAPGPPRRFKVSGIGQPSVYHAVIVIFFEFFSWGLLTTPMITVLNDTFPDHTFLMNGLIVGIKGLLSFLSAPLIGALSDSLGRKFFLLITVAFTCAPIPLMIINTWWYFAMISLSGMFAVTFSVAFAYVADVTTEEERSTAYGLVSATFAASMVISPALGAYLARLYSRNLVVILATLIAVTDVLFILFCVPESMPETMRAKISWTTTLSWKKADPFNSLRRVGKDQMILLLCMAVLLSYLPEAGQYSCFFVYLQLVIGFSPDEVALFIAVVGVLSVVAQTLVLAVMMKVVGDKRTIMVGLLFEMLQLLWYGFGSERWMIWSAGGLASICSITYPAISSFVSTHAEPNKQGLVQGMITGMRSLCLGLGPAVFGFIFYLFHVNLNKESNKGSNLTPHFINGSEIITETPVPVRSIGLIPGPPFVFGALMALGALVVSVFIPETPPRSAHSLQDVAGPSHHNGHDGAHGSLTSASHKEYHYKESHSRRESHQSHARTASLNSQRFKSDSVCSEEIITCVTSTTHRRQSSYGGGNNELGAVVRFPLMADTDPL
ncbi:hippocampus abundant transcript 1 protein-like isoform X2 [Varroa jacobsoni]|uniref:hippocampus abundant transcript 1 protein-like isoform X2 n=1 Tax=Varroa jacobsoni TaxID=62625 RepID=UPI000BF9BB93|nr:hippocampus abundant transcript 1 protein-like isoform X2 [Varroa jacobsoni]